MGKPLRIGKGKPGPGRPKGLPNKMTRAAKEAFQLAFDNLGGVDGMVTWATADPDNLKTFYTLYARLIPVDVTSGEEKLAETKVTIERVILHGKDQKGGA